MPTTAMMNREFGWQAAEFDLPGTDGRRHRLADLRGANGTLVMFICNHCPYVKAVIDDVVRDCAELRGDGISAIAIMPNDTKAYPDDSFDNMRKFATSHGFGFPYVIDETQEVARAYGAACTPDFFGFDRDLCLKFRGRMYEMAPGLKRKADAPRELLAGMRRIARTGEGPEDQSPSVGCSIKWRS
jgi:peroxiredoxin